MSEAAPTAPEEEESELEEEDDGSSTPDYGNAKYWDERYALCPEPFDWYQSWSQLEPLIGPFFDRDELVLNIGCGNAPMSIDLGDFFETVVNIDISPVVIGQMEQAHRDKPNILWFTMDCMQMAFDDETFDVAFDKGTIDALMCAQQATQKVGRALAEVHRVLRPYGLFIEITYGKPATRTAMFNSFGIGWTIHEAVPIKNPEKPGWHFIYIFEKGADLVQKTAAREDEIEEPNVEEGDEVNAPN
jgi:SAM-dependent methyltransferase